VARSSFGGLLEEKEINDFIKKISFLQEFDIDKVVDLFMAEYKTYIDKLNYKYFRIFSTFSTKN
jgi:hypothetical protein